MTVLEKALRAWFAVRGFLWTLDIDGEIQDDVDIVDDDRFRFRVVMTVESAVGPAGTVRVVDAFLDEDGEWVVDPTPSELESTGTITLG